MKTPVPEPLWPEACNFIKKETQAQVFSCEFYEISKNPCFTEHIQATDSKCCNHCLIVTIKGKWLWHFQFYRNISYQ